jgi:hypothetical protein
MTSSAGSFLSCSGALLLCDVLYARPERYFDAAAAWDKVCFLAHIHPGRLKVRASKLLGPAGKTALMLLPQRVSQHQLLRSATFQTSVQHLLPFQRSNAPLLQACSCHVATLSI